MSDISTNEKSTKETDRNKFLAFCSVLFSVLFFVFLGLAFYMLADQKMYVGGDAYNFIINAGKATAFFVAAFGSLISAILIELLNCYKANH